MKATSDYLRKFQSDVSEITLPQRFTFPFYYTPHPLAAQAAQELQLDLREREDWNRQLGYEAGSSRDAEGKMFGVLVVQRSAGSLAYLAAFSGKIAESNHHSGFVPPVFDILQPGGFFRKEEAQITKLNQEVEKLEQDSALQKAKLDLQNTEQRAEAEIATMRLRNKNKKIARDQKRAEAEPQMTATDYQELDQALRRESARLDRELKSFKKDWRQKIKEARKVVDAWEAKITALKKERSRRSAALQDRLFAAFRFLNSRGEEKSLKTIFGAAQPPAGAGECAAPKLLQYAFQHQLQPIAMAEFWWGAPPKSAVRRHGQFYPACRGKCEPILGHMLKGMALDPNPVLAEASQAPPIEKIYEDDYLLLIDKPPGLLSVPGKTIRDSVQWRMQQAYPKATGPLTVHRLDMSTSGLMLIAKTEGVYKSLQQQFIKRRVKKQYVALLEGRLEGDSGIIDLPLRVDLDNRPRQLVCYEYGKAARTRWQKIGEERNFTRVHFFPVTGRTHQLRVHAAHHRGLNSPIVGDELYGQPGGRLHLHAEQLEFEHPVTKKWMVMMRKAEF
ncbi:MAG TPA: pseudouridine synthase [Saprospiraceae bacterium]|nr:pseudouridine synthase [Saprospiraceae bacterium]